VSPGAVPPVTPLYVTTVCFRPNTGILHISGRMDRRQMKSAGAGKGRQDDGKQDLNTLPVLLVFTASENEPTACQQLVDVDANGLFQTDVAVSDDPSSWSVMLSACGSGNGKKKVRQCRVVDVLPPGNRSNDGCHSVANRVDPTGQDHPDKSHYVAKVDFGQPRTHEHKMTLNS